MAAAVMDIQIRLCRPEDRHLLLELMTEFDQHEGISLDRIRLETAFDELLRTPTLGQAWLILCDDQYVGYLILTYGFDLEYFGKDAWITDIYVRPEHQGKGIGRRALMDLEGFATRNGVHALHLAVRHSNTRAKLLYEKSGFRTVERLTMTKLLD